MGETVKRSVSLPAEHSAYIDELVSSGQDASASEVVRAGLRALKDRDAAVERWLREEVASVYHAMQADPSQGIDAATVREAMRAPQRSGPKGLDADPKGHLRT